MKIILVFLQLALFVTAAPFLSGLVTRIKNNLRMRRGSSVLQPYFNLIKLFSKEEVVSETASWIFRAAPFVVIASSFCAALLVPACVFPGPLHSMGVFLALIFIIALGRVFLALSALDTGSAFGGMGSSREMFISSLAEPALCLVVFSIGLQFGSTDIAAFFTMHPVTVSSIVTVMALFLLVLAETSRVPVDNQETHLELTMVHEAMVLEYSGKSLALIELSSYVKQMVFFFLIAGIVFPVAIPVAATLREVFMWLLWYAGRFVAIAAAVALVEVSVAKMRLFRVADFLAFAFVLGIISVVCAILGV